MMKKNLNRIAAFTVLLVMTVSLLVSCGNNNNDKNDTSGDGTKGDLLDTVEDMLDGNDGNVTDDNNMTGDLDMNGNDSIMGDNGNNNSNNNNNGNNNNGNNNNGNNNGNSSNGNGNNNNANGTDAATDSILGFIDRIYEKVGKDSLPEIGSVVIPLDDADAVVYNTGLENTDGIETIIVSEPYISSIAYSLVYIRCGENADVAAIKNSLYENINMRKWVCVEAEKKACAEFGNDIVLVMGAADHVNSVWSALETVASEDQLTLGEKLAN